VNGLSFEQHIPLRAAKFEIKSYKLCDSSTRYASLFIIYIGHGMELINQFMNSDMNKTAVPHIKLVGPLLGYSHSLLMDVS
jgi:hypothetical protein